MMCWVSETYVNSVVHPNRVLSLVICTSKYMTSSLFTLFQNNASKMLLAVMESHQDMDIVERILVKICSPETLVCLCMIVM